MTAWYCYIVIIVVPQFKLEFAIFVKEKLVKKFFLVINTGLYNVPHYIKNCLFCCN